MNPRLIVISGNLKGTIFALPENAASIGRDTDNFIQLNDPSVSRRHCLIEREAENLFFIKDRGSFNGVFVNGAVISERREITHGDQIAIGDVLMFFLLRDADEETIFRERQFAVMSDDALNTGSSSGSNSQSTVRLARADAVYLRPEKLLAELPPATSAPAARRTAADLSALLKIGAALSSTPETEMLQERLLELIAEVIPAERGAILLVESASGETAEIVSSVVRVWKSENRRADDFQISQTVVERCLRESVSLLCNNLSEDEELSAAKSLARRAVHSVLCVPLVVFERSLGVIYLDTSDAKTIFDHDHLQLLTGIAGIAAGPLENALRTETLKAENRRLLEQFEGNRQIIGESEKMKRVFEMVAKIAPTDSTVLILGESGTGKELVARALHRNSARKDRPFVPLNCAVLHENLLESDLFGHEKGSFTGAVGMKRGQFEVADGGTLFLDEIGDLPLTLQPKLLRVLQEREMTRIGGTKPIKVDVRVIAATHRDLEEEVKKGTFREDLYYRLNVIKIEIPPLRERRDDIPLLTHFFIHKLNEKCHRNIKGVTAAAKACLLRYDWKGNVRELENALERAVILTSGEMIGPDDLPEVITEPRGRFNRDETLSYQDSVTHAKRFIIEDALARAGGSVNEAAAALQIHPNNLYRLMKSLGIQK